MELCADVRVQEGSLDIRGELFLFLLYERTGRKKSGSGWRLRFQQSLECPFGVSPRQLPDLRFSASERSSGGCSALIDGEERNIQAEAVLNVNIRLYEEDTVEILKDVYTPEKELLPVCREEAYESLAIRNFSKCSSPIRMNPEAPRAPQ